MVFYILRRIPEHFFYLRYLLTHRQMCSLPHRLTAPAGLLAHCYLDGAAPLLEVQHNFSIIGADGFCKAAFSCRRWIVPC